MPAKRPRVSVTLDQEVIETLQRVSAVEGRSVSAVVGDLITTLEPGLRQVAELGEAFQRMTESQREAMKRAIEAGEKSVTEPMGQAMAAMSSLFGGLRSEVPGGSVSGASEGVSGSIRPPLGNTGVRSL